MINTENKQKDELITEGSALLAEFMGYEIHRGYNLYNHNIDVARRGLGVFHLTGDLQYYKSWDWLMPVIIKITGHIYEEFEENTGLEIRTIKDRAYPRTFGMVSQEGKYMFRFNRQILFEADTLIEAAFFACVDFVTWMKSPDGYGETLSNHQIQPATKLLLATGLARFHRNFKIKKGGYVYVEDSVLWYCIDWGVDWYLSLSVHERINFKQSFFDIE